MLIHTFTDDEGKVNSFYDSTNVLASIYNPDTKKLVLVFGNGLHYLYENFNKSNFENFQKSKSQGSMVHSLIKSHHTTNLGKIDITTIKEDITNYKKHNKIL